MDKIFDSFLDDNTTMMLLVDAINIFEKIQNTSSKISKEKIIRDNQHNHVFLKMLNFLYNPFITTGIKDKKLSKATCIDQESKFNTVLEVMAYVEKNNSGRMEDVLAISSFIYQFHYKEHQEFLIKFFTKSYKCGITSKTINKALDDDYIPEFDLMLAEKYVETKKSKGIPRIVENWRRYIGKRVIATKKLDGNRCLVFVKESGIQLYSREGHLMEGFIEIEQAFSNFPTGMIVDGEILALNPEGLNSKDLFQKTSKIVRKKGIKEGLEFYAFDIIPITEFAKGVYKEPCELRKETLSIMISDLGSHLVHYVEPSYIGEFDKEIIDALAEEAKLNQEEGIMVQLADVEYQCKRTFNILKVKSMEACDIRCLDVYEGKSGKNIGRLGGIICDYKGHRVNVGGGFSDELRDKLWSNPSLIIGSIVEIQYFEEFEDEDGSLDLRFAGFKTIRDDKSEPSYY